MVFLSSLPREKHIKVVSVAGPYRTGKSFLMNRILGRMKGFETGSTVESCTKGVWIWNQPIIDPTDEDEHITLLIDTEGLFSTDRSSDVDMRLFALSVLMASSFIYNQMGPINEQALTELNLIVNLVKFFGKIGEFEAPDFLWCLRDFFLEHGMESADDYMENCLKSNSDSITDEALKKNKIRETIVNFFQTRRCFTFTRPVEDEQYL